MPEINAEDRLRWYDVRWPGERKMSSGWAEKFFDNYPEAYSYFEQRQQERPDQRILSPLHCQENPDLWVVCVDPK